MRILKDWLASYYEYTAPYSEAPDHFHHWVGISTVASVLQRNVWFHMGNFDWYPNFYIILVAGPGIATKSTSAGVGKKLLKAAFAGDYVKWAPTSCTWQGLAQKMMRDWQGQEPDPTCVSIFSSELGQLVRTDDGAMLTFFTDIWDSGDEFTHEIRTGDPIVIQQPWVNLLGCTTPGWLRDSFRDINITGGFASRCCFVYGYEKSKLIPFPGAYTMERERLRQALVRDLRDMQHLNGAYKISPEARSAIAAWYKEWNNGLVPKDADEQGFHSRAQGHLLKICMVVAASRRRSLEITLDDYATAQEYLATALAGHKSVLWGIETDVARAQGRLVEFIRRNREVPVDALTRHFLKKIKAEEIERILTSLYKTGVIRRVMRNGRRLVIYQGDEDRP